MVEKDLVLQPSNDSFGGFERGGAEDVVCWYRPDDPEDGTIPNQCLSIAPLSALESSRFLALYKELSMRRNFLLKSFFYPGSSIYPPCVPGVMKDLSVGQLIARLGTLLSIMGYARGPTVWFLSEAPKVRRNTVYIRTLAIVPLQLPITLATVIETVLVFRVCAVAKLGNYSLKPATTFDQTAKETAFRNSGTVG